MNIPASGNIGTPKCLFDTCEVRCSITDVHEYLIGEIMVNFCRPPPLAFSEVTGLV